MDQCGRPERRDSEDAEFSRFDRSNGPAIPADQSLHSGTLVGLLDKTRVADAFHSTKSAWPKMQRLATLASLCTLMPDLVIGREDESLPLPTQANNRPRVQVCGVLLFFFSRKNCRKIRRRLIRVVRALLQLQTGIVLLVDISGYSSFADRAIRACTERMNVNDELVMLPAMLTPATNTSLQPRQHRRSTTLPSCNPILSPKPMFATESESACVSILFTLHHAVLRSLHVFEARVSHWKCSYSLP